MSRRERLGRKLSRRVRCGRGSGLLGGDLLLMGGDELRWVLAVVVSEEIEGVNAGHLRKRIFKRRGQIGLRETKN